MGVPGFEPCDADFLMLENTKTSIGPPVNIENVSRNEVGSMTSIEIDFQFAGFDLRISIQKGHVEATLNGKDRVEARERRDASNSAT